MFSRGIGILLISLKKDPRGGVGALLISLKEEPRGVFVVLVEQIDIIVVDTHGFSVVFRSKRLIAVWPHTVFHELQVDHDFDGANRDKIEAIHHVHH